MSASVPAATIFDNSSNDLGMRFNPGNLEVGDEIMLAGTDRTLTGFSFEYWGVSTANPSIFSGAVQARVQFYVNNGASFHGYSTPSTMSFYNSDWFTVSPTLTGRSTLNFTAGSDNIPVGGLFLPSSDMTWTVQFRNMAGTDTVGVDLYSPPTIGTEVGDFGDYWENDGGWLLMTNTVSRMDFAAKFDAVPEPSSLVLSLCGGLGILTLAYRLRRKS
jgi:hypothetical protein